MSEFGSGLLTADGGARQPVADLWCTYAATRCLCWLDSAPVDPDGCKTFIKERSNSDGAYGWQRGARSDIWATHYATQTLSDLGEPIAASDRDRLLNWLETLADPLGGYAMTPGQTTDIWASYYACRTLATFAPIVPPLPSSFAEWIRKTQQADGGLGWDRGRTWSDVRAAYYATEALTSLRVPPGKVLNAEALIDWLRNRQQEDGGFTFDARTASSGRPASSCLWATFRAVRALRALGAEPKSVARVIEFVVSRALPGGGFERWPGYGRSDVWACFTAVGAIQALGHEVPPHLAQSSIGFLQGCQIVGSGFTYRPPGAAGDALATAALCLRLHREGRVQEAGVLGRWLTAAQMPAEGGIMYMPARGAEIRCTIWAICALLTSGGDLDRERLVNWIADLQNADGGFGYWEGRGSDLAATTAALEALNQLDALKRINSASALEFVQGCGYSDGYRFSQRAESTSCTSTSLGIMSLSVLGAREEAEAGVGQLEAFASPLGGYSTAPRQLPDLLSTYLACRASSAGKAPVNRAAAARFVRRIRRGTGFAWSPLGMEPAGPLAGCLGQLLDDWAASEDAPELLPLIL